MTHFRSATNRRARHRRNSGAQPSAAHPPLQKAPHTGASSPGPMADKPSVATPKTEPLAPASGRLRRNVGVVVKNREGKVLAGLRTHASGDKAWQLPQGGIEGREKPATAAYRELREETGLDPRAVKLLREHEGWIDYLLPPTMAAGRKFNGQTQKWYLFEYLEQGLPDITKATDKEFEQLAWVEMDWLIAHVIEFRKPVYKKVKSLFRL